MQCSPFPGEGLGARRQRAREKANRPNLQLSLGPAVAGVKVRRRMVEEVHPDHNRTSPLPSASHALEEQITVRSPQVFLRRSTLIRESNIGSRCDARARPRATAEIPAYSDLPYAGTQPYRRNLLHLKELERCGDP